MPSTFTTNTGIELPADGEQSGSWGGTVNLNMEIIDRAMNGAVTVTLSGTTHTLSTSSGALSDGQFSVIVFDGSLTETNTVTIAPDTAQKVYFVRNTTSQTVDLTQGTGTTVSVLAGKAAIVYTDGAGTAANVVDITSEITSDITVEYEDPNDQFLLSGDLTQKVMGLSFNSTALDGNANTAFGALSLDSAGSSSSGNTAIGAFALQSNTTGGSNTAVGQGTLSNSVTASSNTAVGSYTCNDITTGTYNTAVGAQVLAANTTGSRNVGMGARTLTQLNGGDNNLALGYFAGLSLTTGSNNMLIGHEAGYSSSSPFNPTTESNRIVMGNNDHTNAYIRIAWTVTSDERDKADRATITQGVDFINSLNPITFKWDQRRKYADGVPDGTHKEQPTFIGFSAQELLVATRAAGIPDGTIVDVEQEDLLKIKETALIPTLVKAVQELSARVEALENA